MRTITKTFDVYKIQELSDESFKRAIEQYRDWNVCGNWYDGVFDSLADKEGTLAENGFEYVSCSFSGFYSQGDGASVEYKVNDFEQIVNLLPEYPHGLYSRILKQAYKNGNLCIRNTERTAYTANYTRYSPIIIETDTEKPLEVWDSLRNAVIALNSVLAEFHKNLERETYKQLETEYDYLTNEDALSEFFQESDYEFLSNGDIYND